MHTLVSILLFFLAWGLVLSWIPYHKNLLIRNQTIAWEWKPLVVVLITRGRSGKAYKLLFVIMFLCSLKDTPKYIVRVWTKKKTVSCKHHFFLGFLLLLNTWQDVQALKVAFTSNLHSFWVCLCVVFFKYNLKNYTTWRICFIIWRTTPLKDFFVFIIWRTTPLGGLFCFYNLENYTIWRTCLPSCDHVTGLLLELIVQWHILTAFLSCVKSTQCLHAYIEYSYLIKLTVPVISVLHHFTCWQFIK